MSAEVTVVGANGTLGRLFVERLGARGLDLRCPDPRDEVKVAELADARVVVNAGGPRVRPELGWGDYFREHVGVTANIARAMPRGGHLVHISSTAVYGARGALLDAESPEAPTLFPSPAYACAKLAAETTARAIGRERGVDVSVVRPSMVYGPGIDSALDTIRRLASRGVALRLSPSTLRQHLVHVDLLVAIVEALARGGARAHGANSAYLAADPFVLTNDDLQPRGGRALPLPVPVRAAATTHRRWLGTLGVAPGALEALAVLALDNVFDSAPTLRALGIDVDRFAKARTFDRYWGGS